MSKLITLSLVMSNMPLGCDSQALAAEIQELLKKEYSDGIDICVSPVNEKSTEIDDVLAAPTVAVEEPIVAAPVIIEDPIDTLVNEGGALPVDNTPPAEGSE